MAELAPQAGHVVGAAPVDDRAVGEIARDVEHLRPEGGDEQAGRDLGRARQAEPTDAEARVLLDDLVAGEGGAEKAATSRVRCTG